MGALIDLTGQTFGLLRVVKRLADKITPSGARQPVWGCICECGRRSAEEGRALRASRALSCRRCVRDPSRTLKYGRVYVMYWPEHHVLKIGWHTSSRRRLELQAAGGIIIDEYRDVDKSWEHVGRQALDELFPPAFTSRADAQHLLPRGAGWTDCVTVTPRNIDIAIYAIRRAGIEKGNDFGHNPPPTATWRRALTGIQRARRGARLSRANVDRPAGAVRGRGCVAVRPGLDRPTVTAGHAVAPVDRSGDPRRTRLGRGRVCAHVGATRPRMDLSAASIKQTFGCLTPAASRLCDLARRGPIFIGLGERERKREGTRARVGASASTRATGGRRTRTSEQVGTRTHETRTTNTTSAPGTAASPAHRMPETPTRHSHRGMRALRHSCHSTQRLLGQTPVLPRYDVVRRITVGRDGR